MTVDSVDLATMMATITTIKYVFNNGSNNGSATTDGLASDIPEDDVESVLFEKFGPRRDRLYVVVPVSVCYVLILTTGVLGNVCTCIVIGRTRSMHTATNFYLFSLAVSDLLLLLLGLPVEFYELWYRYPYVFGNTMCVVLALCAETSANASILTITTFTVERYLAICRPLSSHAFLSSPSRAIRYVVVVWVMATLLALPLALQLGVIHQTSTITGVRLPSSATCSVKYPLRHSFEIMSVLLFFLPMSVLTVIYVRIAQQLRRTTNLGRSTGHKGVHRRLHHDNLVQVNNGKVRTSVQLKPPTMTASTTVVAAGPNDGNTCHGRRCRQNSGSPATSSSRRSVFKMLVAVVVAFFVCWAPHHTQRIFSAIIVNNESLQTKTTTEMYYVMTYVSGVMYYLGATINPIVYNAMSDRFRTAFLDIVRQTWDVVTCRRNISGAASSAAATAATAAALSSRHGGRQDQHRQQLQHRYSPVLPSATTTVSRSTKVYSSIELDTVNCRRSSLTFSMVPSAAAQAIVITTTPPDDQPSTSKSECKGTVIPGGEPRTGRICGAGRCDGFMMQDVSRKNSGSISNSSMQLVEADAHIELYDYVSMMQQQR